MLTNESPGEQPDTDHCSAPGSCWWKDLVFAIGFLIFLYGSHMQSSLGTHKALVPDPSGTRIPGCIKWCSVCIQAKTGCAYASRHSFGISIVLGAWRIQVVAFWNFLGFLFSFQIFSIHGWLNLRMWNPQIWNLWLWRADCSFSLKGELKRIACQKLRLAGLFCVNTVQRSNCRGSHLLTIDEGAKESSAREARESGVPLISSIDIPSQAILRCGGCPVHCSMSGLYPLVASSAPPTIMIIKNVSRHCPMPCEGRKCPWLRTTAGGTQWFNLSLTFSGIVF